MEDKKLRTIQRASAEIGASESFLKQLIREQKLTKFYVNSAVYISLAEFESIAQPEKKNADK